MGTQPPEVERAGSSWGVYTRLQKTRPANQAHEAFPVPAACGKSRHRLGKDINQTGPRPLTPSPAPIESQRQGPSLELDAGPGTQSPPRHATRWEQCCPCHLLHTPPHACLSPCGCSPRREAPGLSRFPLSVVLSPVLQGRDSNVTLPGTSHIRGMQ